MFGVQWVKQGVQEFSCCINGYCFTWYKTFAGKEAGSQASLSFLCFRFVFLIHQTPK